MPIVRNINVQDLTQLHCNFMTSNNTRHWSINYWARLFPRFEGESLEYCFIQNWIVYPHHLPFHNNKSMKVSEQSSLLGSPLICRLSLEDIDSEVIFLSIQTISVSVSPDFWEIMFFASSGALSFYFSRYHNLWDIILPS